MTPALAGSIAAARDLAWRSTANYGGRQAHLYRERVEAHGELQRRIAHVRAPRGASPELRYLIAAMRRVAAATFSNRYGMPYYERKQAVRELRGCLDAYDRDLHLVVGPVPDRNISWVDIRPATGASSTAHRRIGLAR